MELCKQDARLSNLSRQRRAKCDEQAPTCGNRFRIGVDCPGASSTTQSSKPTSRGTCLFDTSIQSQQMQESGSKQERALHWRFVQRTAPTLAIMNLDSFWSLDVLVSAQVDDGIRKAVLALCILLEQRIADSSTEDANRDNEMALAWYGQSLKMSLHNLAQHSTGGILPLVLSSILYLMIEHQQGKDDNANHLIRHAFDAISTQQGVFTEAVVTCIPVLLQILLTSKIDSSIISIDHSTFAIEKALPWAYKTAHPGLYMLRLRLFKLMHECQTFTHCGYDQGAYSQMLWRLQEWWQSLRSYEDDGNVKSKRIQLKMPLFCLRVWFRMTYIQLQSQMAAVYGLECQETQAQLLLGEWESMTVAFGVVREQMLPALIESTVLPKLIFLVWNTQSAHLRARILRARDILAPYMAPRVLDGISHLISTIIELKRTEINFGTNKTSIMRL